MSALRALLAAMPDIVAVVQQVDERWQARVFDALVNAALSDVGTNGWNTYQQYAGQHAPQHTDTTLMPRVDGDGQPYQTGR